MTSAIARYRKFAVALAAAATEALTLGLLSGTAAKWVTVAIGLLAALGVKAVPNA